VNPKYKGSWVHALRSGNFKQGRGALHDLTNGSYCCLGVLCKIAGVPERINRDHSGTFDKQSVFLSDRLLAEFDIPGELETKLSNKNDCGASFAEIAAWIEENL
jgi:hypothetical protein